jgi:hypothetical protein
MIDSHVLSIQVVQIKISRENGYRIHYLGWSQNLPERLFGHFVTPGRRRINFTLINPKCTLIQIYHQVLLYFYTGDMETVKVMEIIHADKVTYGTSGH